METWAYSSFASWAGMAGRNLPIRTPATMHRMTQTVRLRSKKLIPAVFSFFILQGSLFVELFKYSLRPYVFKLPIVGLKKGLWDLWQRSGGFVGAPACLPLHGKSGLQALPLSPKRTFKVFLTASE
jgi:hypothetical protein